MTQWPHFNWVICHSPYSTAFDGVEDTDYGHTHHELKVSFGRTIGSVLYLQYFYIFFSHDFLKRYDLYWARSGTFYRYGDGGFINVRTQTFKRLIQRYDSIQHSGRIMETYSGPIIVERPFTLEHYDTNLYSRLLSLMKFPFSFLYYFCKVSSLNLAYRDSYVRLIKQCLQIPFQFFSILYYIIESTIMPVCHHTYPMSNCIVIQNRFSVDLEHGHPSSI